MCVRVRCACMWSVIRLVQRTRVCVCVFVVCVFVVYLFSHHMAIHTISSIHAIFFACVCVCVYVCGVSVCGYNLINTTASRSTETTEQEEEEETSSRYTAAIQKLLTFTHVFL